MAVRCSNYHGFDFIDGTEENNRACYNSCALATILSNRALIDTSPYVSSNFPHFSTASHSPIWNFCRSSCRNMAVPVHTSNPRFFALHCTQKRLLARERIVHAYTFPRAPFVRFAVHFINAQRLVRFAWSTIKQPQHAGPRLQRLASLLSPDCSVMCAKSFHRRYPRGPANPFQGASL